MWAIVSGIANVTSPAAANSAWYYLVVAVGYGLLLPPLAVMHTRHAVVRQSGAVLGTVAGTALISVSIATAADALLVVPAVFISGIWWWTIGKIWWETGVLPRPFGLATMALAVAAFAVAIPATATMGFAPLWLLERIVLGAWTLALALVLGRSR